MEYDSDNAIGIKKSKIDTMSPSIQIRPATPSSRNLLTKRAANVTIEDLLRQVEEQQQQSGQKDEIDVEAGDDDEKDSVAEQLMESEIIDCLDKTFEDAATTPPNEQIKSSKSCSPIEQASSKIETMLSERTQELVSSLAERT